MAALVQDHLEMLSKQVLASCNRVSHPSNEVINRPPGRRQMKETLASKHSATVNPYLSNGILDMADYTSTRNSIHTESVRKSIANLGPNPILGTKPPPIASSESTLNRIQRSTLAQLRSGQCHLLGDYKVLTGRALSALCPECLFRRHTVPHIFECDAAPTSLSLRDLWDKPRRVINFLKTLQSFSVLESTDPPVPRPPPEPPPQ